jgi:hypothetical protein
VKPVLFWLAACALAAPAHGFVRSRTKNGTAVHWPDACVFVQPDLDGTQDLPSETVFLVIQRALQNWTDLIPACSYLKLMYDAPAKVEAHLDGRNIVKFRADKWCHPEDEQNHNVCYDRSAAAITTVFYLDRPGDAQDGFILDADVELNNLNFTYVTIPTTSMPREGTALADLENTLTHEFGHLMGLDHTCKDSATPANAVDENGQPPPPCNALPLEGRTKIIEATMFNSATPGEIKKRSPEQDDVDGVCNAYPLAQAAAHPVCKHTDLSNYSRGGCGILPQSSATTVAPLVLFFALALSARRRRR